MKDEIIFTPFYSSFLKLCRRDGLSPTEAARRAGISSGAPTAWKNKGAIPRPEQLKKLCVQFNVSEHELLGYSTQEEKPITVYRGRLSKRHRQLIGLFDAASPDLQSAAVAVLRSANGQVKALDNELVIQVKDRPGKLQVVEEVGKVQVKDEFGKAYGIKGRGRGGGGSIKGR